MSHKFLKVKVKSLAAEARIIRLEERRAGHGDLRNRLAVHRRWHVRFEARHSLLAYGYLRGIPYVAMERTTREDNSPDWDHVEQMVKRFGPPKHNTSFEGWKKYEQAESVPRTATGP